MQVTRWPDWYATVDRALRDLSTRCDQVFVMGLSMGGTLSLRLAQQHPAIAGLVLVNPSLHTRNRLMALLPVLRHVLAAVPGVSNDIKRPGQDEGAYDRIPLQPLHSLTELWRITSAELPRVTAPLLVFASTEDHVVEESNSRELITSVSSADVELVELVNSYHVATLDNDAELIFASSLSFVDRLTAGTNAPGPVGSDAPRAS
jgi:carboxylesterase